MNKDLKAQRVLPDLSDHQATLVSQDLLVRVVTLGRLVALVVQEVKVYQVNEASQVCLVVREMLDGLVLLV